MLKDIPIEECRATVDKFLAVNKTTRAYQKFTCAGCGQRLTMDEPNVFYEQGTCDRCDAITDIRKRGCGYLLTFGVSL